MSILEHAPRCTIDQAAMLARRHFGVIAARVRQLPSERDANFLILTQDAEQRVLKISNAAEDPEFLSAQTKMLQHLSARLSWTPRVFVAADGQTMASVALEGRMHAARLVSYLDGVPLAEAGYADEALLAELGGCLGRLAIALQDFDHPALHRDFHWNLAEGVAVVQQRLDSIHDPAHRDRVAALLQRFRLHTLPLLEGLPKSIIHNDANDGNVIVKRDEADSAAMHVAGLVNFGDATYGWTVGELAVAIAYVILDREDPLSAAATVLQAHHSQSPFTDRELDALFGLVCLRLCMSAAIAAEQTRQRPDDPYLSISQRPIRDALPRLLKIPFGLAAKRFRLACGRPPVPSLRTIESWLASDACRSEFPLRLETLQGQRPQAEQFLVLDWSVDSPLLPSNLDAWTEPAITAAINREMQDAGADIGVGRYLEPRLLYAAPQFAGGGKWWDPRRTLHLGIDLFASAGTAVVAALDGEVFAVECIDQPLDYGGVVILRHELETGESFLTLYGHLAPSSLAALQPGQQVHAGDVIAELGAAEVNGGWTPHLHFQIITDDLGLRHEFPGVGFAEQPALWAALCPDPNLLLRLDAARFPEPAPSFQDTLGARRRLLGGNLSLAYRQPLKIVRGWRQYLFDANGRKYIDAYNNVPHVGHCHPRVVEAAARQMRLLNTNTRYLHDTILRLAERLVATMPLPAPGAEPLEVCYFVNSASEANELALRLSRAATGRQDMVVLEGAYHGHTCSLIDLSPYKHDGPGGQGPPDWVHTSPLADVYRGEFRDPATAAARYAATVESLLTDLAQQNRPVCAFIAESCPSVGGQILFPEGYLSSVYRLVRAAGGVCIADDVQTGYGRLGQWFYGFEQQAASPDIVVLGKPIGNGYPLAAVVATRTIAAAFDNGMEYFSTFGGNPVACAVGLAVLDVLRDEKLAEQAQTVGDYLLRGLRDLQREHPLIGDVRGSGFFLGVELVEDQETLTPAATAASFISNRMRQLGVLLGVQRSAAQRSQDPPAHGVPKP